jgi:hypothetical protein
MDVTQVVKLKMEEKQHEYYEKYIRIFEVAFAFLKRKPVMLYGGLALDQYMPKDLKIYDYDMIPDIDVFSPQPKTVATALADHLKKKGYKDTTQLTTALHAGTYKVFSEGLPIADVSYLPKDAFDMIAKKTKIGSFGLKLVSPRYVQFSLHSMLTRLASVERWEKVEFRMSRFYKVFSPKPPKKFPIAEFNTEMDTVNKALHAYAEETNALLLGTSVIDLLLAPRKPITAITDVPYTIAMVSEDPLVYAKKMVAKLPYALTVSKIHEGKEYNKQTRHVTVLFKGTIVAVFYEAAGDCFGYNDYKGRRVGTIHALLMYYLSMLLSTEQHFINMNAHGSLDAIVNSLAKKVMAKGKAKLQPYALHCIGEEIGLATMKRERIHRIKEKQKK